jgi:hypothetical protein
MDTREITHLGAQTPSSSSSTPPSSPAPATEHAHCDECGAPVDRNQRYCVNCGAHRRHVPDPASRYFSQATAGTRAAGGAAGSGARPVGPRRVPSLALALVLAIIPVAVAVGVEVGRSSNNDDSKLISELSRSQAQLAATSRAGTATVATTTAAAATTTAGTTRTSKRPASRKHGGHAHTTSTTASPRNLNSAPSASQNQQGASIVNKLQHTNGTSYLNQLPSQVSVP